jgi:hypothetical protein
MVKYQPTATKPSQAFTSVERPSSGGEGRHSEPQIRTTVRRRAAKKTAVNSETRHARFEVAVAAWAQYFEENGDDALAFRDELKALGVTPEGLRAKQLGLSVALTPPGFRCAHYGDTRFCVQCGAEPAQENVGLRGELDEKAATAERQSEVIRNQSDAIDRQSAEIRRLQLREQQLLARLASRKPRLFGGKR